MVGSNDTAQNGAVGSSTGALVVSVLMVTGAFLAVAAPSTAWHSDDPIIHSESSAGASAWGVSGTIEESGDVAVTASAWAPQESSQITAGVVVFDENRNTRFMFAFTSHGSPDRTIVAPSPTQPTSSGSWDDGAWSTHVEGDTSVLEHTEIRVEVQPAGEGPSTLSSHPIIRLASTSLDADPGPYHRVVWVGGGAESTFGIETSTTVSSIETTAGSAYAMGDPEIEDGTPNIQVQDSEQLGTTLGVKVMNDASVEIDAEDSLYGFWGLSDFKLACQFSTVGCVWASTVYGTCAFTLGVNCSPGQLSWDGPDGGESGGTLYSLDGSDPGAYTFTVDHKVDLYGPSHYDSDSGTWVSLAEHFSYLTLADVELP